MKEGSSSIAHRLQTVGGVVIDELDRGRNAADSQEKGCIADRCQCGRSVPCLRAQKQPGCLSGKNLKEDNAGCGNHEACISCRPDGLLHAPVIARSKVVGHNRQHALADAEIDRIGDALHLHDNPHARKNQIIVGCCNHIDTDIGHIEQSRQHGGRHTDCQDIPDIPAGSFARLRHTQTQRRGVPGLSVGKKEIDAGNAVGQQCCHCSACDFLSPRKDHKHKQRVQHHVQHAAQAQSQARLA